MTQPMTRAIRAARDDARAHTSPLARDVTNRDLAPITLTLPIVPVSKPRQTRSDQWRTPARPAVAQYRAFADRLRMLLAMHRVTLPECGLAVRFDLPMPASWTARKRAAMRGTPHRQKPDLDNLVKALLDAALPDSDCAVWHFSALEKRWAHDGAITLTLTPIEDRP